jgi:hypothetical protein
VLRVAHEQVAPTQHVHLRHVSQVTSQIATEAIEGQIHLDESVFARVVVAQTVRSAVKTIVFQVQVLWDLHVQWYKDSRVEGRDCRS